jgi:hypothetical protein
VKKELSYIAWNAFLAASLISAKVFAISFPSTIVWVIAICELAMWGLLFLLLGDKTVREAVRKISPFKPWRILTEALMIALAAYCGYKKIACAWVMIAGLFFYTSIKAESKREEDEKPADAE